MTLRWKKNDPERGLRAIGAGPRGSALRLDGIEVASVAAHRERFTVVGWYWVARCDDLGVPWHNSYPDLNATEAEAKAAAMKYVRAALVTQAPSAAKKEGQP